MLRALGWRMLSVTISDFVASILEGLKSLGLTQQRWMEVTDRADEIIQGILPGKLDGSGFKHVGKMLRDVRCLVETGLDCGNLSRSKLCLRVLTNLLYCN